MAEVPAEIRVRLRQQSRNRCGYCQTSEQVTGQPLTVEHLWPVARGGQTIEDNLWLSCRSCNQHKGAQTEAVDPDTHDRVPLFNPRLQRWAEHFVWSGDGTHIIGLTPVGRATVAALKMNNEIVMGARRLWVGVGWHPPSD